MGCRSSSLKSLLLGGFASRRTVTIRLSRISDTTLNLRTLPPHFTQLYQPVGEEASIRGVSVMRQMLSVMDPLPFQLFPAVSQNRKATLIYTTEMHLSQVLDLNKRVSSSFLVFLRLSGSFCDGNPTLSWSRIYTNLGKIR